MRIAFLIMLCSIPFVSAQTPELEAGIKGKLATLKFVGSLYDADTGGYRNEPMAKPSLRATNAAVKATKYLSGKLDDAEKTKKFVLGCYDEKTGAFAEPGGKPDLTTTCIGVMAAMELGIAKETIVKATIYIDKHAKTFEEVRIGAAAGEACGWFGLLELSPQLWFDKALKHFRENKSGTPDQTARELASILVVILRFRIHHIDIDEKEMFDKMIVPGQRDDGGWGKAGEKASDMESVYRVMRAFSMRKENPKNPVRLREFIAKHRNDDGGYAVKPGDKSSAAGTYYAVIVLKWLDELEKK